MGKFFILPLLIFAFSVPLQIQAQDADNDQTNSLEPSSEVIEDTENTPTFWDLVWQNVKERVSLALTKDPSKKAEKQLKYAEQRMNLADIFASDAQTAKAQSRIKRMIKRANQLMEGIDKNKEKWSENKEKVDELISKIASFQLRSEEIFDTIEEKLPPEAIEKFQELRNRSLEISRQLWQAYEMNELPEKIRNEIVETKKIIEQRAEETKQYRNSYQELQDRVDSGDEDAQAELDRLQQERIERMKSRGGDLEDLMKLLQGFNVPID